MILVVGGIKGGSGKTTLATNLTVLRSQAGYKVLLVDADEQRSASEWAEQRDAMKLPSSWTTIQLSGAALNSQIMRLRPSYDNIIIDVGGRDTTNQRSALSIADVFLIPFKPRAYDVWTAPKLKLLITEVTASNSKLKCFAVVTQGDATGKDNEEAQNILKEYPSLTVLDFIIGNRKAFGNTATQGLGVMEDASPDKKAVQEIQSLYEVLYNSHMDNI